MAGEELSIGIGFRQSLGKFSEFFRSLMVIKQMESSNNSIYGIWTSSQNVSQTIMGTPREEQTVHFMLTH